MTGLFEWIVLGDHSQNWVGFIARDALTNDNSYADARNRLTKLPLMAPAYFILGGNSSNEVCMMSLFNRTFIVE